MPLELVCDERILILVTISVSNSLLTTPFPSRMKQLSSHQPPQPHPFPPDFSLLPSTIHLLPHLARARRPRPVVRAALPLARLDHHAPLALPLVPEVAALALRVDAPLDHVGHGRAAAPVARVNLEVAPVGDEAPVAVANEGGAVLADEHVLGRGGGGEEDEGGEDGEVHFGGAEGGGGGVSDGLRLGGGRGGRAYFVVWVGGEVVGDEEVAGLSCPRVKRLTALREK